MLFRSPSKADIREDLPEPTTPTTATISPCDTSSVMLRRVARLLLSDADSQVNVQLFNLIAVTVGEKGDD